MSNKQLYWLQLHVSTLCIVHRHAVLRLVEQLYNKQGILGGGGTRSRLYNSGWHNLGLYKITITPP
jgi:hypothetical protein